MKKETSTSERDQDQMISRKTALQKTGKYAAFTAATMMILMSPATSVATNHSPGPGVPQSPKRHR